jgi:hypothetical protein
MAGQAGSGQGTILRDSPGPLGDPLTLAGWSRELSANQWQPVWNAAGSPEDRNVILA